MINNGQPLPWRKILFKTCFILGIILLEQASLFSCQFLLYNKHLMELSLRHYLYCLPFMVVISVFLYDYFKLSGFYREPISSLLYSAFKYVAIIFTVTCVYAYLFNLYALSRYALALGSVLFYMLLVIWTFLNQRIALRIYEKVSILIVAQSEEDASRILAKIKCEEKNLNLMTTGWLSPADVLNRDERFVQSYEILISSNVGDKDKFDILVICSRMNKLVYIVPSFYDLSFSKYKIVKFYDTPAFEIENRGLSFQQQLLKRVFDILFSALILVLTSPLQLLVALLIKLDSKGPVFYTQDRVTYSGEVYKVYKFRTMVSDAEKLYGAYQSSESDPRVTKIGRILRTTHLDELPQFLNVILGSMSVVGPRSDRTITIGIMDQQAVGYDYRLKVKSGITGMAQLFGKYNSDPEDKLRYDVYYIKNYSLFFDLQLIFLTILAMVPTKRKENKVKTNSDYFIVNK